MMMMMMMMRTNRESKKVLHDLQFDRISENIKCEIDLREKFSYFFFQTHVICNWYVQFNWMMNEKRAEDEEPSASAAAPAATTTILAVCII